MPVVAFMKAVVGEGVQPERSILANKPSEWHQGNEVSFLSIASDDVTDGHKSGSTLTTGARAKWSGCCTC